MSYFTPKGRVCILKKWTTTTAYGFSLDEKFFLGYPVVKNVLDNSPALCSGVLPRDIVIEINGQPTCDMTLERVKNIIRDSTHCTLFVVQTAELNFLKMYFPKLRSSNCPQVVIECPAEPPRNLTAKALGISELECSLLRTDAATLQLSYNRRMAAMYAHLDCAKKLKFCSRCHGIRKCSWDHQLYHNIFFNFTLLIVVIQFTYHH
uniref:PDZ domain (Also known as DHR or GLGF) n=1 Tax=Schistocephalus solidus TaxID=70667 RepID=A0A0X3PKD1_SCHSO